MRYYVIMNGVNSLTIQGLAIRELPPISKPSMRNIKEEIDGRNGDIITELGYSAYDKELEIGLYGESYDINDIIAFFNGKGTITFSDEPDKYYYYQILNQIDYEKLLKFKTASVVFHCQPFKYKVDEVPLEEEFEYVEGEGTDITLNNTANAIFSEFDLKGNTSQATTTGKNLFIPTLKVDDTNISTIRCSVSLSGDEYTFSTTGSDCYFGNIVGTGNAYNKVLGTLYDVSGITNLVFKPTNSAFDKNYVCYYDNNKVSLGYVQINNNTGLITPIANTKYIGFRIGINNSVSGTNYTTKIQLEKGSTATDYEPYTGNIPAPNPDYPQDIHVVSGDNDIIVNGKNSYNINVNYDWVGANTNYTITDNTINVNGKYFVAGLHSVKPNTNYTISATRQIIQDNNTCGTIRAFTPDKSQMLGEGKTTFTFNTGDNNQVYVLLYAGLNEQGNVNFSNIQLEKGSSATDFEPYQGNTYNIDLPVENLFDKDNANYVNGWIDGTTMRLNTINGNRMFYMPCKPNTTYTISRSVITSSFRTTTYDSTPFPTVTGSNVDYTVASVLRNDNGKTLTITTNANAKYLVVHYGKIEDTNLNETLASIQVEYGSKQNNFTPYGTTPIELCKIGDYQDYFYEEDNKWYIERQIGKLILNGSENYWSRSGASTENSFVGAFNLITSGIITKFGTGGHWKLNRFTYGSLGVDNKFQTYNGTADTGYQFLGLTISTSLASDLTAFKDWLSSNNVIVYYILHDATNEEITDAELIDQLNAIKNAKSYDTTTHINQNTANKPFILNATAVQKGTDEAVINNEGNIYSKPTLDIEGTGIVDIYLNDVEVFQVDLSVVNEIVINTAEMEAYNPNTHQLANRQVTGDYSNFKLDVGENDLRFSGNLTKAKVTYYQRWL